MSKDFDAWNNQKKILNESESGRFYHIREIWWCSLGVNVGYEQDGRGEGYQRPILVLRSFSKHVCLVVPLTTSDKYNKYHVYLGLVNLRPAYAIISQIRLIDTKRFINRIDILNEEIFLKVKEAVKALL